MDKIRRFIVEAQDNANKKDQFLKQKTHFSTER